MDERRLAVGQHGFDAGKHGERLLEPHEIARSGRAERRPRQQPLEILYGLHRLAELAALGRAERQFLDGVEPVANRLDGDERTKQPRAQLPAADRRHRAIQLGQQRALASALGSLEDLEMFERRGIDEQRVGPLPERDPGHVREVDLLRVSQVVNERAGR